MPRSCLTAFSALLLAAFVSGCASLFAPDCARFERERPNTDYATHYQFSDTETNKKTPGIKALARHRMAAAPLYALNVSAPQARRCTYLRINKQLFFQRQARGRFEIEEVRDLYAGNGRRIATKKEFITAQLARTGYYTATVPLPILENTPPGTYRIVSRLMLKPHGNGKPVTLARAEAQFNVPEKKK
jgi:hypothetical protein